jgi:hypothetical protein
MNECESIPARKQHFTFFRGEAVFFGMIPKSRQEKKLVVFAIIHHAKAQNCQYRRT